VESPWNNTIRGEKLTTETNPRGWKKLHPRTARRYIQPGDFWFKGESTMQRTGFSIHITIWGYNWEIKLQGGSRRRVKQVEHRSAKLQVTVNDSAPEKICKVP